jgi:molybdate transport system substrate-binding protein
MREHDRQATRAFAIVLSVVAMTGSGRAAEPVLLHAAGSLRGALNEVAKSFETATGLKVQAKR